MDHKLAKQLHKQFYRKNFILVFMVCVSAFLTGIINLFMAFIIQQLIDTVSGMSDIKSVKGFAIIFGIFASFVLTAFLLEFFSKPLFIKKGLIGYKNFAFEKICGKDISSFKTESTAHYLSALTNDITVIETDYLERISDVVIQLVCLFGAVVMMLIYSPLLTAFSFLLISVPVIVTLVTGGRLEPLQKETSGKNKKFLDSVSDYLSGFTVIKSFKAEKEITDLFENNNEELESAKYRRRRLDMFLNNIGSMTGAASLTGIFVIGIVLSVKTNSITPGIVVVFVQLMNYVITPASKLPALWAKRKASVALIDKLAEELERNQGTQGGVQIDDLKKSIRMEDVSFGYEPDKEVLHDISLEFEYGKSYAIVGKSGSGKSTLVNLLINNNKNAYKGRIFYDDKELDTICSNSLFELVSIIQQNVFLFNSTIKNNITLFKEFEDEKYENAVKHANLSDFILEKGDDYICGENGSLLSGGEKQRVSIARSLLRDSSVLIADEITSSLDNKMAFQIINDVLNLNGLTRIVITHSFEESLLKRFDEIIVLKDGRIEEKGTFDSLMAKDGYFRALYRVS